MLPLVPAGGVTDQVTVWVAPGSMDAKLTGLVAWTLQPAGVLGVRLTLVSSLLPVFLMVAVAVVAVPAVSAGWVCGRRTVLATCTLTAGRPALPSVISVVALAS